NEILSEWTEAFGCGRFNHTDHAFGDYDPEEWKRHKHASLDIDLIPKACRRQQKYRKGKQKQRQITRIDRRVNPFPKYQRRQAEKKQRQKEELRNQDRRLILIFFPNPAE